MDANFNPYREWLGLDGAPADPTYYELLGLEAGEESAERITAAVDRAIAKVRSCRPGAHAALWANLLDELTKAKRCLLDAGQRQQYDAKLARPPRGSSNHPSVGQAADTDPMYPSGTGGPPQARPISNPGAPSPLPSPQHPLQQPQLPVNSAPAQQAPTVSLPSPLAPTAARAQGAPMASYPVASMAVPPNPMDPMAPVGGGYPSTQPNSHPAPAAAFPASGPSTAFAQPVRIARAKPNVAKAMARRKRSRNTVVMLGFAVAMMAVCAGIVYLMVKDRSGGKKDQEDETVAEQQQTMGQPARGTRKRAEGERKTLKPVLIPEPSPAPDPNPWPVPAPNPNASTAPMFVPEPTPPEPAPMPAPQPMPTAQELAALSQAMAAARAALAEKNPEAALAEVAQAEQLAQLDEHKAMVSRLEKVAGLVQEFWAAVDRARTEMTALDEIDLPTGNKIVVVESSPELLIVKINGQSRQFTRRQESTKFATVIADRVLPREDPHSRIVKGAAFVVEANEEWRGDGVEMWKESAGFSDEGTELLEYLDDNYDLSVE